MILETQALSGLRALAVAFCCLVLIAHCLLPVTAESDRLSIYAPQAHYSLPVADLEGHAYVGIFELLEPLATPQLTVVGVRWRLRIPDPKASGRMVEAEFQEGSSSARVRGQKVQLSALVRSQNHRLLIPLHGIGAVLIPLLGTELTFHEASRRMFLAGAAQPVSTELRKGDPSTLALHFPAAVSPMISSDGNSIKLSFTRDPVVSFSDNEVLNDNLFNSSNYAESNGTAIITVSGSAPLLAKFADEGKTILITAAPALAATTTSPMPPASTTEQAPISAPSASPEAESAPPNAPLPMHPARPAGFLVVIDAGHGGSETGARIAPNLPEKDLTLSLARKLRQELQSRHIAVVLLRDSDVELTLDQRAVAANLARPTLFISIHADPGSTLRLFTPIPPTPAETADQSLFLPWQTAQAGFAGESKAFATEAAAAVSKRQLTAQVRPAFLQPLHSIAAPAIAIEVPAGNHGLKIPEEQITGALAETIAARKASSGAPQ